MESVLKDTLGHVQRCGYLVTYAGVHEASVYKQVYTNNSLVLVASIVCVSCRDTNQFVVSTSRVIKLVGDCLDCASTDTVYSWTVTRTDGVPLSINLDTTTTGRDRRNLVVRSNVLQARYAYRSAFLKITP